MNDSRRPDARKQLADELAALLAAGDQRAARLLQLLGVVEEPAAPRNPAPPSKPPPDGAAPISIWRPVTGQDGAFERPEPDPLGDHFATRRRLSAAKLAGRRRVVYLGESAAAGYLYAPHLTPAGALGGYLGDAWEVVDLARTNETLDGLAATAEAATQLAPDAWIVFAGNNWDLLETPEVSASSPSIEARQRFALALRQAGLAGPVELARRRLRARAADAFARLARAAGEAPVVLILPAVNLLDWPARQPVPWLPGDGSRRWHRHLAAAEQHLAEERWEEAEGEAEAMLQLEGAERRGGVAPTAHRLRARAATGRGDRAAARAAARAEVDAERYPLLAQLAAPRAGSEVREALLAAATRHHFHAVDLESALTREEDGDQAPGLGRDAFLDYCHLSRLGIGRLTAAAAEPLAESCGEQPPTGSPAPHLAREAEATALLGAAIHSAHRLTTPDRADLLASWCRRALAADPEISESMVDVAAVRAARVAHDLPEVWTEAQRRQLTRRAPLQLQHGWRWHHLDADLLLAMHRALLDTNRPREADRLLSAVVGACSVGPDPVDLADPRWLWEPLARFLPDALARPELDGRAMLRAPWPRTGFSLVTGGSAPVEVEPLVRLPPIPGCARARRGRVGLQLDGRPVGGFEASRAWSGERLTLPTARLAAGIHRLDLVWPELPAVGDEARAGLLDRLERGIEADLHPVFGEVFSMRCRTLAPRSEPAPS